MIRPAYTNEMQKGTLRGPGQFPPAERHLFSRRCLDTILPACGQSFALAEELRICTSDSSGASDDLAGGAFVAEERQAEE